MAKMHRAPYDETAATLVLQELDLATAALDKPVRAYSKGMNQKLGLAACMLSGKDLYILDEPTTGLHFHDIALLLKVIHRLRDQGNTVVIIEHNLDVIKTADWLVDLGPEGGAGGGQIIASGTPEQVAKNSASFTGKYLAPLLLPKKEKKRA